MSDTVIVGSISHGTMREEDLIPTFLDVLEELDPDRAEAIHTEYATEVADPASGTESVAWLMHDLFDALDACAPDGHYFGASDGDGSDYGFWPVW